MTNNNYFLTLIAEVRHDTAFVGDEQLKRAKKLLPLTRLMRLLGDGQQITTGAQPCHLCNVPGTRFRMYQPGGRWTFSCTGKCGRHGDQIQYLKAKFGLSTGDNIEACKWYRLAAAQGNTNAINNRDELQRSLTPEQIQELDRRTAAAEFERDFYEKYPDLKSHKPLLDAIASELEASGYKGKDRESVMEMYARTAREKIKQQQQGQTNGEQ